MAREVDVFLLLGLKTIKKFAWGEVDQKNRDFHNPLLRKNFFRKRTWKFQTYIKNTVENNVYLSNKQLKEGW